LLDFARACMDAERERLSDELRAENERLRAALAESCDEHRSEIYDTATGGGCVLLRDAVAAERERQSAEIDRKQTIIDGYARLYSATMKSLRETVSERDRLRAELLREHADRPVRPGDEVINKAVHEAVSAIYFDDSSDYRAALWSVVRLLAPDLAEMLETNERTAWQTSDDRANARVGD
jgi:hypothetical protein